MYFEIRRLFVLLLLVFSFQPITAAAEALENAGRGAHDVSIHDDKRVDWGRDWGGDIVFDESGGGPRPGDDDGHYSVDDNRDDDSGVSISKIQVEIAAVPETDDSEDDMYVIDDPGRVSTLADAQELQRVKEATALQQEAEGKERVKWSPRKTAGRLRVDSAVSSGLNREKEQGSEGAPVENTRRFGLAAAKLRSHQHTKQAKVAKKRANGTLSNAEKNRVGYKETLEAEKERVRLAQIEIEKRRKVAERFDARMAKRAAEVTLERVNPETPFVPISNSNPKETGVRNGEKSQESRGKRDGGFGDEPEKGEGEQVSVSTSMRSSWEEDAGLMHNLEEGEGGREVRVDPLLGQDIRSCATEGNICKTIRFAVKTINRVADPGTHLTVRLAPGFYRGECSRRGISVNRSLTIVGAGASTLIDCNFRGRLLRVANPTTVSTLKCGASGRVRDGGVTVQLVSVRVINGRTTEKSGISPSPIESGGGAVHVSAGCSLFLVNCSFAHHIAIDINSGDSTRGGGAVFVDLAEGMFLVIEGCIFENCTTTSTNVRSSGGGVCVRLAGKNRSGSDGSSGQILGRTGAEWASWAVRGLALIGHMVGVGEGATTCAPRWVRIADSVFRMNVAALGGGMYVGSDPGMEVAGISVNMHACTFLHNSARSLVSSNDPASSTLGEGGAFALLYRGAVVNSSIKVIDSTFRNNFASGGGKNGVGEGGGFALVYVADATNTSTLVLNSSFVENDASSKASGGAGVGGGFALGYAGALVGGSIEVIECEFSDNTASGSSHGGTSVGAGFAMIFVSLSTHASLFVRNTKFHNNRASSGPGGVSKGGGFAVLYVGDAIISPVELTGCQFTNNAASATSGGRGEGGGFALFYFGKVAETMGFRECSFQNNSASGSVDGNVGKDYTIETRPPLAYNWNPISPTTATTTTPLRLLTGMG
jgi:hypothetical protein